MEFNEKLQELRKKKGLTQDELAKSLYVSRTAISKWESGRGYPSIDSLKAIAKFFSVTVDELLSSEQILSIAEEDGKKCRARLKDLMFALLDISALLLLFLPLFADRSTEIIRSVSLLSLSYTQPYLKISYFAAIIATVATGVLTLALKATQITAWMKIKNKISLVLSAISALLFILSLQAYAAVFTFAILIIKGFLLITRP
jgi:transcriptional regulator with XRE-family HTH domain